MSGINQAEVEDGVFEEIEAEARCVTLVPVGPTAARPSRLALIRPDASFVAQLIATAEQLPQTRSLRRGAPAEALTAYRSFEHRIKGAVLSTRQVT